MVRNYKNKKSKAAEISQNITSLFRQGRTPHPDWISTKSFQSTGETFGLIDPIAKAPRDEYDTDSDISLNKMGEVAGDQILETEATAPDTNETKRSLPPSAWWILLLNLVCRVLVVE
jgi:hypothetical protein